MPHAAKAYTTKTDSREAGNDLGSQIKSALDGQAPDALIVFASPRFSGPFARAGALRQWLFPNRADSTVMSVSEIGRL